MADTKQKATFAPLLTLDVLEFSELREVSAGSISNDRILGFQVNSRDMTIALPPEDLQTDLVITTEPNPPRLGKLPEL